MQGKRRREAIREGMARARAEGVRVGRPRAIPRGTRERIVKLRAQGMGYQRIADQLNTWRIPGRYVMARRLLLSLPLLVALVAAPVSGSAARVSRANPLSRIEHIVVIYEENHSFDNLYGGWEGVTGISAADAAHTTQISQGGTAYACLLQDDVNLTSPPLPPDVCDTANGDPYSSHFMNEPFTINTYIRSTATTCPMPSEAFQRKNGIKNGKGLPGGCTRDLVHRFYQEQYQLNGGSQNRYVTGSDAAGLAMGVYDTQALPIYDYLHSNRHPRYAILDDFFQAAFGGSFLNHQWLIAAATPVYPDAARPLHSVLDAEGMPVLRSPPKKESSVALYLSPQPLTPRPRDRPLTSACPAPLGLACGDYAVNTMQPASQPTGSHGNILPLQEAPTIGDRLTRAGIDWAWYSGGWSNAAGLRRAPGWTNGITKGVCADPDSFANPWPYCPNKVFQFHHQPFVYYANYAPGTPGRAHLRDEQEFIELAQSSKSTCNLKPVSFVKPIGQETEHPGYASEPNGSNHLVSLLQAIEGSKCGKDTMVIVTYDEFGGQWDHVPPPGQGGTAGPHDKWGPGPRVPALVISPFLRENFVVDHTQHDTTSILATIEHRFGLAPLSSRDASEQDLSSVFSATSPPSPTPTQDCTSANRLRLAHLLTQAQDAYTALLKDDPNLPCAITGLALARQAMAEQAFEAAEALEENGLHDDAVKQLSVALQAYPDQKSLLTSLASALKQRVNDPFAVAIALDKAGFQNDAITEFEAAIKSRPDAFEAELARKSRPPDFDALLRSIRSKSTNTESWWQRVRGWGLPPLRTAAEILAVVAILLVVLTLAYRLARFLAAKPLLINQFTAAPDLKLGDGLTSLIGEAMFLLMADVPGSSLQLVSEFEPVVSVSADLSAALPQGKYVTAAVGAITSLLPGRGWLVSGYQHERGDRGAGLTLSLATRSKTILEEATLWERDYVPIFDPVTDPTDNQAYWRLAAPAAAWVLYRIQQEDRDRYVGSLYRWAKGRIFGRVPLSPATRSWKSYALFAAGVAWSRDIDHDGARTLYEQALGVDPMNRAAIYNLAALEIEGHEFETARHRLEGLKEVLEKDRHPERDPLWYRTLYMLGVIDIHEAATEATP